MTMRTPRVVSCVVLSSALWLGAGALHAREGGAPSSEAALAEGRARFEEGIALAERGEHDAAAVKFREVWRLVRSPNALFNLARSEQLAGDRIEALLHFREFLSLEDPKITPRQRTLAAHNIAELTKKVAHIDVVAAPGTRVLVDGQPVDGDLAEPIPVSPGEHVVSAVVEGKEISVRITCAAGTAARADLQRPRGIPPRAAHGSGASSAGGERSTLGWAVPIGLGAAGLVAFGAGIALSHVANGSKDAYEALERPGLCADPSSAACSEYQAQHRAASSERTAAIVSYVGGGALAAASVAAFLLWPKERASSPSVHVAPAVGAHGGGAVVHVAF